MRHLAVVVGVAVVALLAPVTSGAQQAQQIPISIDDHFQSEFWSEQCGFDVSSTSSLTCRSRWCTTRAA